MSISFLNISKIDQLTPIIFFSYQAIDIFTDMGRFVMAAKHHSNVAELYEADAMDIEKAISHYEKVILLQFCIHKPRFKLYLIVIRFP